jgi:type IV secretory pathway VirB4 component
MRPRRQFTGLANIMLIGNPVTMSTTDQSRIIYLGRVDYRNDRRLVGMLREDRFSHLYVLGKTGTGKSTLLENMALQDLEHGNGFALIDPHGELADRIAAHVPSSRQSDVLYLDAGDPSQPYGYNPLRHVREDRIAVAASGFLEVFKRCGRRLGGCAWSTSCATS